MNLFCTPFNDPSSPWYYVVGVVCLLLVFGALAAYILLSKKFEKKKSDNDAGENPATDGPAPADIAVDAAERQETEPTTADGEDSADDK